MGNRKTRKAGILQSRHSDPKLQRSLDAIIERLEVLDGLRGDELDRAITYRDLSLSGFTVLSGAGGPYITDSPGGGGGGSGGGGDGPGIGPAGPPSNLNASETFLAILLTWDNPSFNLQHIEVYRSLEDNLSTRVLIGTTVSPQYMDYVGASASYYYWVRAVGTDGTFSAFNDTAGTLGTTGIDPSDFELELNISASNLDAALAARIDLIDFPLTGLVDRVTAAEGDILAVDSRTTTLESTASSLQTSIDGNTTLIGANAAVIATQSTSITQLLSDMGVAQSDIVDNAAAITVNASDILDLYATVGALDPEGGKEWEFLTTVESWTGTNATVSHNGLGTGSLIWTPNAADPQLISPTFSPNVSGGIFTQVVARVKQTQGGGTWEGRCYFSTAGHGMSDLYYKQIADPSLSLNVWKTLTWDMSSLTVGGTDWIDSTITGIRFDLVSDNAAKFEFDWIIVAKFSTTAIAEAISALDVRITTNEGDILSQGTSLTVLENTVNDPSTGLDATATALTALTSTVNSNTSGISSNSSAVTALQNTVNNPSTGVLANASAISTLETDVSNVEGVNTAQATDITQLVARIEGGYASIVNPLTGTGENYGTSYTAGQIQAYNVGGRSGVAARIDTNANVLDTVERFDGTRINVDPNGIYEVNFSIYHNRPTNAGMSQAGMYAYSAASGGATQSMIPINNGVAGTATATPAWMRTADSFQDETWMDVTCYFLGSNVDAAKCPNMVINGSTDNTGYTIFNDGYKVQSAPYVVLRFLNYNTSPTYGDGTTTTTFVTNLRVHRIDSGAENYAILQTQATATASDVGDLNALYAVNVELRGPDGHPYVSGFGLAADVINGVATSAFGILADQFFITYPSSNEVEDDEVRPFTVGLVDGVSTVGIQGQLIVDGTIRGTSIVAGDIGADRINVTQLSALSADMGTLTSGLIRTAASPAWRVELEDSASTAWPIWYGSNAKSAANGLFYVTASGDVIVKGLLNAGMIKQSYFTPADGNNTMRIACEYYSTPSTYSGGVYTGKAAHINPVLTTGYNAPEGSYGTECYDRTNYNTALNLSQHRCGWHSTPLVLYSPTHSSSTEYGRLGSLSENVLVRYSATFQHDFGPPYDFWLIVKYKYDSEVERFAFIQHMHLQASMRTGNITSEDLFITRDTPWDTLQLRIGVGCRRSDEAPASAIRGTVSNANISLTTMNLGYADQGGIVDTTSPTDGTTVPVHNPNTTRRYY